MRAFIAIPLPEFVREQLDEEQRVLRRAACDESQGVTWARPEGIHLTLKFLGEIAPAQVGQIRGALGPLSAFAPFSLEIKGLGCFPTCARPRVLWAGVAAPPGLYGLAAGVESALAPLGFSPEDRRFSPHLTLARLKINSPYPWISAVVRDSALWTSGAWEVSEFCLFQSQLIPRAPARYLRIATFGRTLQKG